MTVPHDQIPAGFCGNETFDSRSIWQGNQFGLCFREIVISNLPLLVLIPGGIWRALQLSRMRKKTKVEDVRVAGIKKTVLQRRWFWAQFTLCVATALLAQLQLLDAILFHESVTPVLILSDSLRSLAWGAIAMLIYFEYKKWLAHSAIVRWFYIASLVTSILKDSSLIADAVEKGRGGAFFWSFQVVVFLQLALTVMGSLGFVRTIRKKLEPWLPPQFLIEIPQTEQMNLSAMLWAAKPDVVWWIFAIIFAVVQGIATISFVEYTAKAVDAIRDEKEGVRENMQMFAIWGVTAAATSVGSGIMFGVAGMRYVRRLRVMLIESLMVQEMAFFDTTSPGALIGHLTADTDKIADLKDFIPWFITPACQVIYGAGLLFKESWHLSLVVCALLVVEFVEASARSKQVTHKYSKLYTKTNRGASEKATEVLASFVTIRLFGQMQLESSIYGGKVTAASRIGIRKEVLEAFCQGVEVLLHSAVIGLSALYAFNLIDDHLMNRSSLTEFLAIGNNLIQAFQDVIKTTPLFAEVTGPAAIIVSLIKRKPLMDQNVGAQIDDLQGHISFQNVSFSYPSAHERTFSKFNLDIPAGQSIAFVGPSGCGKSSLYKLFLRFYDPQDGCIKIDQKHELRDLKLKWWLDSIGVVSQEPVLFKGSLRYNILYGLPPSANVTEAQLMEAVKCAQLQSLVDEKGLDFDVGDKGGNLSGGQKQRTCIARVFLRQPKILLLDEITSALDALSEAEVMKAVTGLMEGRTTFVIAHRLHTIVNVDKVCVLKKGKIVDTGTHDELVAKDGFYREMWSKQQGGDQGEEFQEETGRSWGEVDTLLDLLERNPNTSPEIIALARRIRPRQTRLGAAAPGLMFGHDSDQVDVSDIDSQNDEDEDRFGSYVPPQRRRATVSTARPRRINTDSDDDDRSTLLQDRV